MKKYILSVIFLLTITAAHAQYEASLSFSGGYTEDGYGLALGYNQIINQKKTVRMSGAINYSDAVDDSNAGKLPYTAVNFSLGAYYKLLKTKSRRDRISLFLGGGGTIGYEELNSNNLQLDDGTIVTTESKMLFGAYVGGEFNYLLTNYISAIVVAKQFYDPASTLGDFRIYAGAGIRIKLFEN